MSTIKSSSEDLTLNADGSGKDIKFQSNGVEKASISSAGAFTSTTIDATALTGNLPAISGASLTSLPAHTGNVAFPATQVASADANTLDDYEEGSWTPILHGATTTTYTEQGGVYTRIGRFVFFTGVIIVNSVGDGSTYIIGGLPFSASSPGTTNLLPGGILVQYHDTLATSVVEFSADVTRGASTVLMRSKTAAAANPSTNALFQNSGRVNCSGFYQV